MHQQKKLCYYAEPPRVCKLSSYCACIHDHWTRQSSYAHYSMIKIRCLNWYLPILLDII